MTESERTALFEALSAWRNRISVRYHIPDHKRLALVVRHDAWISGVIQ